MLEVKNIRKLYGLSMPVLRDVSFKLRKGEMAFLVGKSGAGKSTLIKMIYMEERPDSGDIILGSTSLNEVKPRKVPKLRRQLGVVFQDFKLISERTAWENVALALEVVGKSKRQIENRVSDLLRLVGLSHRKTNYPDQLSGGECQRVAIARALANEPLLLLADEPTGNLDRDNSQALLELLNKINVQGCSVLMATHNIGLIEGLPNRKLFLEEGTIRRDLE
jgi:cell division transport system ATP-binding protein